MYEFVGAIAARSMMIEGQVSSTSISVGFIGFFLMQIATYFTKESFALYLYVWFKFTLAWLVLSSLLGCIALALAGFNTASVLDHSPRTRAWMNGPHLSPWMRAIRDIGSCIFGVYVPLDPYYIRLVENGIGWNGVLFLFLTLFIGLTATEAMQDKQLQATKSD